MEITHSYEGLSQAYFRARKGSLKFVTFMLSRAGLEKMGSDLPPAIVELGVGSGQQTEFVVKQLNALGITRYKILAFDKSSDQLDLLKDRIKKGEISQKVLPYQLDFDRVPLPVAPESIDLVYMAWVFHHLTNQQAVLNEIARITRRGSGIFMHQVTIEAHENHPLAEFFPMIYEYDKKRYPTLPRLKQMFIDAGFTFETPYIIKNSEPIFIDRAFLESVANTSINSVLRMIKDNDPAAFKEGVLKVELEVKNGERSGKYRNYAQIDRSVFWGFKQ